MAVVSLIPVLMRAQEPTVYTPGDGVSLPVATRQVRPQYTREAMQNRIEGSVGLSAVVLAAGTWVRSRGSIARHGVRSRCRGGEGVEAMGVRAWDEGRKGRRGPCHGELDLHAEVAHLSLFGGKQWMRDFQQRARSLLTTLGAPGVRVAMGSDTVSDPVTLESTASSSGVMRPSCRARITVFQAPSNFFQPAA